MTYDIWWEPGLLPLASEESDPDMLLLVLDWVDAVAEDPDSVVYEPVPGRNARVSPVPSTPWTITWAVFDAPVKAIRLIRIERRKPPPDL